MKLACLVMFSSVFKMLVYGMLQLLKKEQQCYVINLQLKIITVYLHFLFIATVGRFYILHLELVNQYF